MKLCPLCNISGRIVQGTVEVYLTETKTVLLCEDHANYTLDNSQKLKRKEGDAPCHPGQTTKPDGSNAEQRSDPAESAISHLFVS